MLQRLLFPCSSPAAAPPPVAALSPCPTPSGVPGWTLQRKFESRSPCCGRYPSFRWGDKAAGNVKVASSPRSLDDGLAASGVLPSDPALLPNALRRERHPTWSVGFSLGVDLGNSRTGLALGKGLAPPRPLIVLEMRGQKLETRIMEIAKREEVDEFIIGLPRSHDGKETVQSNKVRSIAGRLAVRAAESGWRVFLQDEHGTSVEALDYMIDTGLKRSARQGKIDSYAAVMVLERYFSAQGHEAELVLPKQLELLNMLRRGPCQDEDFLT
ncbi:unnamed protein product [Spirodela intermedia]|uniref:YqgF/RNase H-like domain-containing protein n=1 Tax=Spirodela intermedia TaxID=51605 RepID=A0A7I8L0P1_SPIIN|nr:unnamed protein product [Spirodela intermedia]